MKIVSTQLKNNYLSYCDPRLNKKQTLNIIKIIKKHNITND